MSPRVPFGVTIAAGVVRARFGAARLGRSGVGLLSMASSLACLLGASVSSSSCLLFEVRVGGTGWFVWVDAAHVECAGAAAQGDAGGAAERPKPKPRGEGE